MKPLQSAELLPVTHVAELKHVAVKDMREMVEA